MFKESNLLWFAIFSALLFLTANAVTAEKDLPGELDRYVTKFATQRDFSGVVLVEKGNDIVFHEAYDMANLELKFPARTDIDRRTIRSF